MFITFADIKLLMRIIKHNKIHDNFSYRVFYGGLSWTNLTLWGFLENPRTFEIQSGQEKRALEGSFLKMVDLDIRFKTQNHQNRLVM